MGNGKVPTAFLERPLLSPKSSSLPHGGHDEKDNGGLDPLIGKCSGGSDANYDSTIESSTDRNGASEGGPGLASNLCLTRGDNGSGPANEGRDDVCNERWDLADDARDWTCDGGSMFTVAQILQIVAMTGHAMMTGIIFSRDNDVACDGGTHHII